MAAKVAVMVLGLRVVLGGTIVTAIFWLLLGASALAARPNSLDLHVDALTTQTLLTEPATALVDPARQAGALRRAHWTVFGFVLTAALRSGRALLSLELRWRG